MLQNLHNISFREWFDLSYLLMIYGVKTTTEQAWSVTFFVRNMHLDLQQDIFKISGEFYSRFQLRYSDENVNYFNFTQCFTILVLEQINRNFFQGS